MTVVQRVTLTVVVLLLVVSVATGSAVAGNGGASPDSGGSTSPGTSEQPSTSTAAILSSADRRSFLRLASGLAGSEGVAVSALGTGQPVWFAGSLRRGVAWSTAKVPVAMAAIKAGTARSSDLTAAITASDNSAAERLWSSLGGGSRASAAATRQLRQAGDKATVVQSRRILAGFTPFGQTSWALVDQVRFTAGMGCLAAGRRVLGLMGSVVAGQRWGLGSVGSGAAFKGGWGPGVNPGQGNGWLDRQMGIIRVGGRKVAVAIATTASGHGTGTSNLTRMAAWVHSHVNPAGLPAGDGC